MTDSKDKITVLHLTPFVEKNGLDRGVLSTVKKLLNFNINSIVCSMGGSLIDVLEKMNITHITFKSLNLWNGISKIKTIIKTNNINLIHSHSRFFAWCIFFVNKFLSKHIPFIITFHAIYRNTNSMQKFYNNIMTKGDHIIAISEFTKNHLLQEYSIPSSKITVVSRGVDSEYFNKNTLDKVAIDTIRDRFNTPKDTPILLLPGKLTPWKGHVLLVEALKLIKDLNFYCLIVGNLGEDINYSSMLIKKIKDAKLQSKIQIFGLDEDIRNIYNISNVVLSTSIEPEAFSRVLIEAQSMEKLVIASDLGCTPEIVTDNLNGFIFKHNNAESLSEKIIYSLSILGTENESKITSCAREGVVKNYSEHTQQDKIINIYKNILFSKN
jgi:glycosyltransferase involved in cell wall biosynthesis